MRFNISGKSDGIALLKTQNVHVHVQFISETMEKMQYCTVKLYDEGRQGGTLFSPSLFPAPLQRALRW